MAPTELARTGTRADPLPVVDAEGVGGEGVGGEGVGEVDALPVLVEELAPQV